MMMIEAQEKLKSLFDKGLRIKVKPYGYVDGFATRIYKDGSGLLCYDSDMYCGRELFDIDESAVEVFKPVENWQGEKSDED
jgi:hypothetical protein